MKTLRGQLTAWFIGLITVIGVAGGIGAGYVSLNEQNSFLDDQLRQIALSVGDTPSAAGESSQIIAGVDPDDRIIVHILDNDMKTIRNSDPTVGIPVERTTGFYDHVDAGLRWRTFTLIAENRVVQVSQETEPRTTAAFNSMLNTVLPIALLIPFSWILVGWLVKRLLKPLQILAAALLARQAGSNMKLSAEGIPGEVVPVAHQLRTPLTALNLQMENLKMAMSGKANAVLLGPMQKGLNRISALLSQLLKLARADEPHAPTVTEFVNLSEIVRAGLANVHEHAAAKAIDLGLTADANVKVRGETLDLTMLLGNLLDNAVRYTPDGGKVDVEILAFENDAQVNIRDTGPGIPESALALVFNRFYRHDPTGTDGSGLGLSIVAALAARNEAEVSLQNRDDKQGLIANVRFKRG
jgi:two-component system, OmpR family, sensor kinase